MKQYTLADGRSAFSYFEIGEGSNVIVSLVEVVGSPNTYKAYRHSYAGGDLGVTKFGSYSVQEAEDAAKIADKISGIDGGTEEAALIVTK
jgi:hypothetical protein